MKFNKKQLEIIAHSLALHVEEVEVESVRLQMEIMLGQMQEIGIWGSVGFNNDED